MKKLIVLISIFVLFVVGSAWAGQVISSGVQTTTTAVVPHGGRLWGINVQCGGDCTFQIHDNASAASGTLLTPTAVKRDISLVGEAYFYPLYGVRFINGCYVTITGTISYTLYYEPLP